MKWLPRIGIDEKDLKKGQSDITMLDDLDNSTAEAIVHTASIGRMLRRLSLTGGHSPSKYGLTT